MPTPLYVTIHPATGGGFDAVETGVAADVGAYATPVGVMVSGTFVATIVIEVSFDGTSWAPFGSALTAPGTVKIDIPVKQVRARCSAFTSGLALAWLAAVGNVGGPNTL